MPLHTAMPAYRSTSHIAVCLVGAYLLLTVGCASYHMGAGSLYAPDVQTIYVPMVESESYRRDVGERLTEALVKQIELQTPYKVVSSPDADAVLSVRLTRDLRRTLIEDAFDAVRAAENSVWAEVTYLNRRRAGLAGGAPQTIAVPPELVDVSSTALMVPAIGQTVSSSQQVAIQRLAEQIVGSMEEPW